MLSWESNFDAKPFREWILGEEQLVKNRSGNLKEMFSEGCTTLRFPGYFRELSNWSKMWYLLKQLALGKQYLFKRVVVLNWLMLWKSSLLEKFLFHSIFSNYLNVYYLTLSNNNSTRNKSYQITVRNRCQTHFITKWRKGSVVVEISKCSCENVLLVKKNIMKK